MTKIEKFLYYKDYYLKYTLIIAAFLIVAVYVGYTIFKPDPPDTFFFPCWTDYNMKIPL